MEKIKKSKSIYNNKMISSTPVVCQPIINDDQINIVSDCGDALGVYYYFDEPPVYLYKVFFLYNCFLDLLFRKIVY